MRLSDKTPAVDEVAGERMPDYVRDLRIKDIVSFLKERVGPTKCPICGHKEMGFIGSATQSDDDELHFDPERPGIVGESIHEAADGSGTLKMPVYKLSCTNCGHLMTFSVGPVLDWKNGDDGEHGKRE
jgi:hypothetical protein